MSQLLDLFNFRSTKERDDFIIAILVLLFFGWLLWWLFPRFMSSDVPPIPEVNAPVAAIEVEKDTDSDGIPDHLDECVTLAGIAPSGCPADSDADGVYDAEDKCPNLKGISANAGCPSDSDGDGIYDKDDKCPKLKGTAETNGCPLDSDNDGVYDTEDKCPNKAGLKANKGCPAIKMEVEEKKILEDAIQAIEFETGSANLKRTSRSILYRIAKIMNKYPDYKVDIIGHTDNQGESDMNLQLSKDRANSCLDYLTSQGIDARRITAKGFGDKRPIESNDSPEGKSKNRRVEFKLHY